MDTFDALTITSGDKLLLVSRDGSSRDVSDNVLFFRADSVTASVKNFNLS